MIIGTIGVGLLVLAFALNLAKCLSEQSPWYLLMNLVGAMMAAWYAWDGRLYQFVALEGIWAAVALVKLVLIIKKGSRKTREP